MAAVESAAAPVAAAIETLVVDPAPVAVDAPSVKPANAKSAKAPKEKKIVTKKPALHPPYVELIREAITSLKERTGSSQYAISKFVEDKHTANLPANFKKLLLVQLRKLTAAGKLTKVKNSYKIAAKPVASVKKTSVSAKPKIKSAAAAKLKSTAVKPKPKSSAAKLKAKPAAAKPKTKPAAEKLKTAAKSKAVALKPKTAGRPSKVLKTSSNAAPAKPKKAAPTKKAKIMKKAPAAKKAPVVKKAKK